jgi:AraC-like DNA-binding protein
MVCIRCKIVVESELKKMGLNFTKVELGEVETNETVTQEQRNQLNEALKNSGLELIDDKRSLLVEKIKNATIEWVHYNDEPAGVCLSEYISKKLNHNYTYLSNTFSELEGTTIEKFYITHKVERAKELLIYNELNITEIAHRINYSSVAHLSYQFKKVTGLTPTCFKRLKNRRRISLDEVGIRQLSLKTL